MWPADRQCLSQLGNVVGFFSPQTLSLCHEQCVIPAAVPSELLRAAKGQWPEACAVRCLCALATAGRDSQKCTPNLSCKTRAWHWERKRGKGDWVQIYCVLIKAPWYPKPLQDKLCAEKFQGWKAVPETLGLVEPLVFILQKSSWSKWVSITKLGAFSSYFSLSIFHACCYGSRFLMSPTAWCGACRTCLSCQIFLHNDFNQTLARGYGKHQRGDLVYWSIVLVLS